MSKTNLSGRPLSPHIQIYRPQLTSVMSILHRITGVANTVGLALLTWFIVAIASGPEAYGTFTDFVGSPFGQILLVGWTASNYYHLFNGIRHLGWDAGFLLNIPNAYRAGYIVWGATVLLTAATWACIWFN